MRQRTKEKRQQEENWLVVICGVAEIEAGRIWNRKKTSEAVREHSDSRKS